MRYRLVHLSGSLAGRVREVDSDEIVLGRDPDLSQVVFGPEDRAVSRRHAILRREKGAVLLRDLDSSTGTWLLGQDVEEAELADGDVFTLGTGGPQVRIEFSDEGTLVVTAPQLAGLPDSPAPSLPPAPRPGPQTRLRFTFQSGTRSGASLELAGAVIRIGRAEGNAVWTPQDRIVSAQHAKIVRLTDAFVLIDLESTNGTYLNGRRIERTPLRDRDLVGLGPGGPQIRVEILEAHRSADVAATVVIPHFSDLAGRRSTGIPVRELTVEGDEPLTVGRSPDAGIVLDSPIVSRQHARFRRREGVFVVEDLDSSNGTYVGTRPIERAALADGDRVVVGPFSLVVSLLEGAPPRLKVLDTRNRARLDARGITVKAGPRTILERISLSLPAGSFTAIIGPSGSGKSTLLGALSGARPASAGAVLLNGVDLYRSFAALKASLGYVPQDDIVHRELTVEESLNYTARLRLPGDTRAAERAKRISDVLATLELTERREMEVHSLSGGQRKRVSIAAELLTEPNLLFLDEPTSGLDPGLEESLMLLLRELSYKGKTVVLVTHTLDNIHLCDAVVLMVDGFLGFYGTPEEARSYFGIEHMVNLYARLKERPGADWHDRFQQTEVCARRVVQPLEVVAKATPGPVTPAPRSERVGARRQFRVLTTRYLRMTGRDTRNALLLLLQAPIIAGLIGLSMLYGSSEIAYTKPKNTLLFLLALTAVWFGCSNAARELVKERPIYLRERMVNLRIVPYLLSKLVVLSALALVQCVAFLAILHEWFGIPGHLPLLLGAMMLSSVVGILLGLAISALVGTADRAMTLLPILLIPQVLFTSPSVHMDMKGPAGYVARAMPTWWSFDLLRRIALEPDAALHDDSILARLGSGGRVLMSRDRFESMLREGYMLFQYRSGIETTWTAALPERLAGHVHDGPEFWRPALVDTAALGGFALALFAGAAVAQRRHDRRR